MSKGHRFTKVDGHFKTRRSTKLAQKTVSYCSWPSSPVLIANFFDSRPFVLGRIVDFSIIVNFSATVHFCVTIYFLAVVHFQDLKEFIWFFVFDFFESNISIQLSKLILDTVGQFKSPKLDEFFFLAAKWVKDRVIYINCLNRGRLSALVSVASRIRPYQAVALNQIPRK